MGACINWADVEKHGRQTIRYAKQDGEGKN